MRNQHKYKFFKGKNGKWHWHIKRNGRIIADSSEGYNRPSTCRRTLFRLLEGIRHFGIDEET